MMSNQTVPQGYKQTEVGVISQDWGVVRLGDISSITTGKLNANDKTHKKRTNITVLIHLLIKNQ